MYVCVCVCVCVCMCVCVCTCVYESIHNYKYNVCFKNTASVTMKLQRTPNSIYEVTDYKNGSYGVHYIANATGINLLEVFVNNIHIDGSPFKLDAVNGEVSEVYSIASGRGLEHGETGQVSYFQVRSYDLSKNRKDYTLDSFSFQVKSNNTESDNSTLKLCPKQKNASHPICDGNDEYGGHFYGSFIPIQKGNVTIHIYVDGKDIKDSPFPAEILTPSPFARGKNELRFVSGSTSPHWTSSHRAGQLAGQRSQSVQRQPAPEQ